MKRVLIICVLSVLWITPGYSRDFIVEFIEENYKETQAQFSYDPLIYHSIQVNSSAGPKVLILAGDDYNYRKWLRHYIAHNKKFITTVENDRVDEFITSTAYKTDVTSLHPFNGDKWGASQMKSSKKTQIQGYNNILIVDPNEKRTHLVTTVIKKMGYRGVVFSSANKALDVFKLQPDRFKMVIAYHSLNDMASEDFVDHVIKTDHTIPVIVDIGYKKQQVENQFKTRFSGFRSVHLKQVILRELPKTIKMLMKKSV